MRDYRCGSGAGTTAHPGRNENHVCASEHLFDTLTILFRRRLADRGFGARTQTLGDRGADLQLGMRLASFECLSIGIDDDELDSLHALFNHVIHGVAAAATHPDYLDHRILRLCFHDFKHRHLLKKINL